MKRVIIVILSFVFLISFASAINITYGNQTPTDSTALNSRDNFYVNVTIGNFTGTPNVILELNNSFRNANYTMVNTTSTTFQFNITYLINSTFQYRVYANDSITSNTSTYRTITINYTQPWEFNSTYWKTTYINKIAPFWVNQFVASNSAFYMNINKSGQSYNDLLRSQMLGRDIYGMSVAYNLTGNETYKSIALNATDLLRSKFWDSATGGFSDDDLNVTNASQIINSRNQKNMFSQSWSTLGFISAYWISSNSTYLDYAQESYSIYDSNMWNSTDKAYADIANDTWTITSNQYTFSSTVDVAIGIILPLYSLTGNSTYLTRLKEITDSSISHMINESNDLVVGNYNPGWNNTGNKEVVSIGHNTKYAWYLLYMYNITGNETYKTQGVNIFNNATEKGWEDQYNLWYDQVNTTTNRSNSTTIYWWDIEDGMVGGQILYQYTGDNYYYDLFKKSAGTYLNTFLDQTNGEVYEIANETGSITNFDKGYEYKSTYHSSEAAILLSQTMDGFLGVPYGNFGTLAANTDTSTTTTTSSSSSDYTYGGVIINKNKTNSGNENNDNETTNNNETNTQEEIAKIKNKIINLSPIQLLILTIIALIILIGIVLFHLFKVIKKK